MTNDSAGIFRTLLSPSCKLRLLSVPDTSQAIFLAYLLALQRTTETDIQDVLVMIIH
jgi:hypothetical protein